MLACTLAPLRLTHADGTVPDCSLDPACIALFDRAKEASAAGNLDDALRQYKLAYDVRADPRLLFSIARILHKQGKPAEALDYYERFLSSPVQDQEPRQRAETYVRELRATTAPLRKDGSTPIYRSWWFWTLVGGVVIGGVAAGVAMGVSTADRAGGIPEGVPTFRLSF